MENFKAIVLVLLGLFILDRFFLWMERKGWVYYRYKKPSGGGGVGSALEEFNALLNPSVRKAVEIKQQQEARPRDDQGDDKDLKQKLES
jgi:hypothetical protein